MLSPLYMAEISPPEVRGSLIAIEQFAIVLGVVIGFWTGFFTRDCMPCLFGMTESLITMPFAVRAWVKFMANPIRDSDLARCTIGYWLLFLTTLSASPGLAWEIR